MLKLNMEAVCSFHASLNFHRTTRRHIPEDRTLRSHRCENLEYKSVFQRCTKYYAPLFEIIFQYQSFACQTFKTATRISMMMVMLRTDMQKIKR
jgi:hypothetical protein